MNCEDDKLFRLKDYRKSNRPCNGKWYPRGYFRICGELASMERELIIKKLEENNGNRTQAAIALGISRRTIHRKIKKYQLAL